MQGDERGWTLGIALLLIVVLFFGQLLFGIIALIVLSLISGEAITSAEQLSVAARVAVDVTAYLFGAAVVIEVARYLATRAGWRSFREAVALTRVRPVFIGIGVGVAILAALASDALSLSIGKPIVPYQDRPIFADPAAGVAFGAFAVLVPPFVEEVVFRGILFGALLRLGGARIAIVASSVTFALIHTLTYGFDWYTIGLIAFSGFVLALVRTYTRSLWPCVAAHSASNAYASLEGLLLPSLLGFWP